VGVAKMQALRMRSSWRGAFYVTTPTAEEAALS
jgi:hypothetical protein